jgi:hypothetical protein
MRSCLSTALYPDCSPPYPFWGSVLQDLASPCWHTAAHILHGSAHSCSWPLTPPSHSPIHFCNLYLYLYLCRPGPPAAGLREGDPSVSHIHFIGLDTDVSGTPYEASIPLDKALAAAGG